MKTRSETAGKTKVNGTAKRLRAASGPQAMCAGDESPREQMIAEAAYYRAEQRGFMPGSEMDDWLQAEADVERALNSLH